MRLKFSDSEDEYTRLEYTAEENTFFLHAKSSDNVCTYSPRLALDPEHDPSKFSHIFLHNERADYSENSIYQVYVDEVRIGWIFPMQALLSDDHSYAGNGYFLKYAYVATWRLLNDINSWDKKLASEEIKLEDFYDENLTLLIVDEQNTESLDEFRLENYTVSLFQHGYSYTGSGNLKSQIEKPDKKIRLKPLASQLQQTVYIDTLFREEIPKTREAFAEFHLCYQVIELLIARVFEDKYKKYLSKLEQGAEDLLDKREELIEMISEKRRVKWLFAEYTSVQPGEKNILNESCQYLLRENSRKIENDMAENLYNVRCLLVHSMYTLSNKSHDLLEDINTAFLDVIMETLLTFECKPAAK